MQFTFEVETPETNFILYSLIFFSPNVEFETKVVWFICLGQKRAFFWYDNRLSTESLEVPKYYLS